MGIVYLGLMCAAQVSFESFQGKNIELVLEVGGVE